MADGDQVDVKQRRRKRRRSESEHSPRERRRRRSDEDPVIPQRSEMLAVTEPPKRRRRRSARIVTPDEEVGESETPQRPENMLATQIMQSEPGRDEVASSQDVTKDETKRLDIPRHWTYASNFQLPVTSPLKEPQSSAYNLVADQILDQLYVAKSGGCVNFQLVELLRTSDASQIKADALRAEGQALLDEAKAIECVGRAISKAYECLAGVAVSKLVGNEPQTVDAVTAVHKAAVNPPSHSKRRAKESKRKKEIEGMKKCDIDSPHVVGAQSKHQGITNLYERGS